MTASSKPRPIRHRRKASAHTAGVDAESRGLPALLLAALLVAAVSVTYTATAEEAYTAYYANKVSYHNKGAYKACFSVNWTDVHGKNFIGKGKKCAQATSRQSWELSKIVDDLYGKPIELYSEVKVLIDIVGGDSDTCRRESKKIFMTSMGSTVKYKSAGTTLNNNGCKIDSLPRTSLPASQHEEMVADYIERNDDH